MHEKLLEIDQFIITVLILNGVIFYSQSLFAYLLMSLISPVTFRLVLCYLLELHKINVLEAVQT